MPNRWIEFVKKWSSENNVSYGCALSKPEMKAEYSRLYPKVVKVKRKGVAKLEESRPPADVKSKVTYPNLTIKIPSPREEQENIQFEIEEMDDESQPRSKKGRPTKYMTEEEKYKAKLESNKQKRREKAAAKKSQSQGGLEESIPNVAPVKASKKVLTDPNLMAMIEGFKPEESEQEKRTKSINIGREKYLKFREMILKWIDKNQVKERFIKNSDDNVGNKLFKLFKDFILLFGGELLVKEYEAPFQKYTRYGYGSNFIVPYPAINIGWEDWKYWLDNFELMDKILDKYKLKTFFKKKFGITFPNKDDVKRFSSVLNGINMVDNWFVGRL